MLIVISAKFLINIFYLCFEMKNVNKILENVYLGEIGIDV